MTSREQLDKLLSELPEDQLKRVLRYAESLSEGDKPTGAPETERKPPAIRGSEPGSERAHRAAERLRRMRRRMPKVTMEEIRAWIEEGRK